MTSLIENLIAFNLTRQEAAIYVEFLVHGEMSGTKLQKKQDFYVQMFTHHYKALQKKALYF